MNNIYMCVYILCNMIYVYNTYIYIYITIIIIVYYYYYYYYYYYCGYILRFDFPEARGEASAKRSAEGQGSSGSRSFQVVPAGLAEIVGFFTWFFTINMSSQDCMGGFFFMGYSKYSYIPLKNNVIIIVTWNYRDFDLLDIHGTIVGSEWMWTFHCHATPHMMVGLSEDIWGVP